jgi:hypothetical protein
MVLRIKRLGRSVGELSLEGSNGKTKLNVSVDLLPEFEGYFDETFPKALNIVSRFLSSNFFQWKAQPKRETLAGTVHIFFACIF